MRIVIAGYHPVDPEEIRGGVEAITLRLVEGLVSLGGHEIHVVTTRPDQRSYQTRELRGRTLHVLPRSPFLGNLTFMAHDRRRLRSIFTHLRPDIIHAHSTSEFALAALESAFPTAVSVHGIAGEEGRLAHGLAERVRAWGRRALEDRVLARARDIVIVSPYVADLFGHLFRRARTHVLETSVSDLFFEGERHPAPATVLFAGLIIPRKGVLELVESARELRARQPAIRFRLAGSEADPAYAERVRTAIEKAGLGESFVLLGGLAPTELARELARATLLVLPSFQETAPVAIQEAMAAGVPVVATDVGGNRHLVKEGETGHLVPAGNPRALAEAMADLVAHAELVARMGRAARAEARARFASHVVAERSVAIYRQVIQAQVQGS